LVGEVAKQAPLNTYLSKQTNLFSKYFILSFTSVMKPSEFNTNMMQTDLNMYEIFGPNRLWILLNPIQNLPNLTQNIYLYYINIFVEYLDFFNTI